MKFVKFISYVLALALFTSPVGAQVIPRAAGGGAAAAGGATEATLLTRATEATQLLVEADTTTLAAATHLEDVLHVTGDRGMAIWGVRNDGFIALSSTDLDYTPIGLASDGSVLVRSPFSANFLAEIRASAAAASVGHLEDEDFASGDGGILALTVQNEALATLTATPLDYGIIATERSGIVIGSLVAGNLADSVRLAKLEDAPSAAGHPGMPAMGVINVTTSIKAADGDYTFLALARSGASLAVPVFEGTVSSSFRAIHREDTPHVTGDAGFLDLGVVNTSFLTLAAANADYVPKAHTTQGLYLTSLVLDTTLGDARVPVKNEDTASGGGMAGIATLGIRNELFAQLANANLDYIQFSTDKEGRQYARPMDAVLEEALVELIGINEQVDTSEYGGSVAVTLAATHSGEWLKACLTTTEDGSGTVLTPAGTLFILDADPATTAGDASITAVERLAILAQIAYAAADWQSDANGATNCKILADGFHANSSLIALWFHEDAVSFNDVAGDDEQLELAFWYRRDS